MASGKQEYLDAYLDDLRRRGRYTFNAGEVIHRFQISENAFKKTVQRLINKNRISRLRKEFYLILPPEYSEQQTLPLGYFVDDLLKFLERNYYVGLLTAAMYHGAAHQQPQSHFIITEPPSLRPINNRHQSIIFCLKNFWSQQDVDQQKTDAGYINISNPALTAVDLIFYSDRIGGYNRAATVLSELVLEVSPDQLIESAKPFSQTTTLQRLGYFLEVILEESELSDALFQVLETRNCYPVKLNPKMGSENHRAPNRWKVIPNMKVEPESI